MRGQNYESCNMKLHLIAQHRSYCGRERIVVKDFTVHCTCQSFVGIRNIYCMGVGTGPAGPAAAGPIFCPIFKTNVLKMGKNVF